MFNGYLGHSMVFLKIFTPVLCVQHPVADIAAQTAAALALSAKVLLEHGEPEDASTADRWMRKAVAAYEYARKMVAMHGAEATCTASSAARNCVGAGCEEIDTFGNPVRGVRTCLWMLCINFAGNTEHASEL